MSQMTVGIVGLGLIGGSMAKAVKASTPYRVLGFDKDVAVQTQAEADGTLDGKLNDASLAKCNIVLLALYPQAAIDYVQQHADSISPGAYVVDLCGVKRPVCAALMPLAHRHGFYFVGGHPMAGLPSSGYASARADLFERSSMILTPGQESPAAVVAELREFFTRIGFGNICLSSAAEHDEMIAYTSQLAHVVSSVYVQSPASLKHCGFSAGSFEDMTRVAVLNEAMWTELFLANRDCLLQEVDAFAARLGNYAEALRAGDAAALYQLLHQGCLWKTKTSKEG